MTKTRLPTRSLGAVLVMALATAGCAKVLGGQPCKNGACPAPLTCEVGLGTCLCTVGQNGAQCRYDTDCGFSGAVCDSATCTCVGSTPDASTGSGGVCGRSCTTDGDCTLYDRVESCQGGKCVNACKSGKTCEQGRACLTVNGVARCEFTCTMDSECSTFVTPCKGVASDGTKFCSHGCTTDADCDPVMEAGYVGTKCINGNCGCLGDSHCTADTRGRVCAN